MEDGNVISRKVAPYSYRTRNTKVRGRSTYFYGEDFTPGEDHGIKCFLIENCLDAKESKQSFTPKHPVEIKREIDELERKREEQDRQDKEVQDKVKDELNDKDNLNNDQEDLKRQAKLDAQKPKQPTTPKKEPPKKDEQP